MKAPRENPENHLTGGEGEFSRSMPDLLDELRAALADERRFHRQQWDRTLTVGDYFIERWDKATEMGFGQGSSIYDSSVVIGHVEVGENTWIGPFVVLDGSGGLRIGNNCSVSAGVQIYSHDTVRWAVTGGRAPTEHAATVIGNNCYIGPNVIITKGVTIGDGCIIGANSFVNGSFPNHSKVWGSPGRCVT